MTFQMVRRNCCLSHLSNLCVCILRGGLGGLGGMGTWEPVDNHHGYHICNSRFPFFFNEKFVVIHTSCFCFCLIAADIPSFDNLPSQNVFIFRSAVTFRLALLFLRIRGCCPAQKMHK